MDQTSIFYLDFVQIHIHTTIHDIFILYFILSIIHLFIFILIHSLFCCFFFIYLNIYLLICLFIYLFVSQSVYLFINFIHHHFKIGFEIHALFIQSVEKRKQQTTTKNTMAEGDGVCKDVSLWLI